MAEKEKQPDAYMADWAKSLDAGIRDPTVVHGSRS